VIGIWFVAEGEQFFQRSAVGYHVCDVLAHGRPIFEAVSEPPPTYKDIFHFRVTVDEIVSELGWFILAPEFRLPAQPSELESAR